MARVMTRKRVAAPPPPSKTAKPAQKPSKPKAMKSPPIARRRTERKTEKKAPAETVVVTRSQNETSRKLEMAEEIKSLKKQLAAAKTTKKWSEATEKKRIEEKVHQKLEQAIQHERRIAESCRKQALDGKARLVAQMEQQSGQPLPWRYCEICTEVWNNDENVPRVLDCGHTFCEKCIDGLLNQPDVAKQIICPFDRTKIKPPRGGIKNFPKNFLALNM